MNKVLEYIIRAKDATGSAVSSALSKLKNLATGIFKNATNILSMFTMIGNGARSLMDKMQRAFAFETMTIQFKTLVGNMDEAREHMAMLQKMGETPPFSLEEFAGASRSMMVMTDGVLGFKHSLELVGDAAAATGQPIQNLAHEVGRAFAVIRDGQPIARAVMGLRNMGVITPEVAAKLDDLQKAGASTTEIWGEMEKALGRFNGAMEETEKTGDGLIGAISAQWDNSVRSFGGALMDTAKGGLGYLLEKMKQLNEDGTIELWAEKINEALVSVMETIKELMPAITGVWKSIKLAFVAVGSELGRFAGAVSMGEFGDAFGGIGTETAKAYTRIFDPEGVQARKDEERKSELRERKARQKKADEEAAARKAATEEQRKQEALAEGQRKIEEKAAKERAAKDEEEMRKAAEAQAREDERARQKEEAERLKLEQKIHAERVKLQQAEIQAYEKEQSDAEKRLAEAQAKVKQAWGWYRDKDSLAAQIAEEKADAEARKQYEKDYASLRDRRRDWRTATDLSLDDEAVRRVALAKEEEVAAQKAVAETAENTRLAAASLAAIEEMLEEE